jgi:hypothetical protein
VEVIRLGEGAEGAFVRLKDAMKTVDVLDRRKFMIEFADIWGDKDAALYTDALHSIEMSKLYAKYTGERLQQECVAKVRRKLPEILDIKDPAARGEYVSFGLIGTPCPCPPLPAYVLALHQPHCHPRVLQHGPLPVDTLLFHS